MSTLSHTANRIICALSCSQAPGDHERALPESNGDVEDRSRQEGSSSSQRRRKRQGKSEVLPADEAELDLPGWVRVVHEDGKANEAVTRRTPIMMTSHCARLAC
jgi:hypothetical protein